MRDKEREYQKEYFQKNKVRIYKRRDTPEFREYQRKWRKDHYLTVNGERTRVNKRPLPEGDLCEVCGTYYKALEYHHWESYEKGIWLCYKCHRYAEYIDKGWFYRERYAKLKALLK